MTSRFLSLSLARRFVMTPPAVLQTRSTAALVAGTERNLRATRDKIGNSALCVRHHSSGSSEIPMAGREKYLLISSSASPGMSAYFFMARWPNRCRFFAGSAVLRSDSFLFLLLNDV